jgi:hypothetical protein
MGMKEITMDIRSLYNSSHYEGVWVVSMQKGNSRRSLYDICVSSIVNNIVFHIGEMSRARTKSLIP